MSEQLLSPRDLAFVDAIAERVLELLAERGAPVGRSPLVSAGELAEILGTSRDYVYRHSERLGAVRLGGETPRPDDDGEKHGGSRLRFDVEKALAAQSARQASEDSQAPEPPAPAGHPRDRRRRSVGSDVPMLPNRGRNADRSPIQQSARQGPKCVKCRHLLVTKGLAA